MERTITAVATPPGIGAIAIIRISGPDAVLIADRVFKGKERLCDVSSHTVNYGHIVDKNGEYIDEVLVSVMRAPRTFTREDVVEINTHGGTASSRRVMDCLIAAGAYPAQPGEFTKRAFVNGRIDLSQAEAIIDIINSSNELAQRNAVGQLNGVLSSKINEVRDRLVHLAAGMQVIIDYPDEDLEDVTTSDIYDTAKGCLLKVRELLKGADGGQIIKNGILTAIAGRPNVGKSSLLNFLAGQDRAIVTDVAGTTRDVIEEYVNLDGIPLRLLDTAGIRETGDKVEKIGVERSMSSIQKADFVIVVLDSTQPLEDTDIELLNVTKNKRRVILVNKSDISAASFLEEIKHSANCPVIEVSAKTGAGMELLKNEIANLYGLGELSIAGGLYITNMRHKAALINAEAALSGVCGAISDGMPADIASIDLNIAIDALGEITGASVSEDIVDAIFHDFCVGK